MDIFAIIHGTTDQPCVRVPIVNYNGIFAEILARFGFAPNNRFLFLFRFSVKTTGIATWELVTNQFRVLCQYQTTFRHNSIKQGWNRIQQTVIQCVQILFHLL